MECPKCEREITADEKNCPYCKYDLVNRPKIQKEESELYSNYKKWIVGGIIVFVAIIIIGASMDDTNKTTSSNTNNTITNTSNNSSNTINTTKIEKVKVEIIDFSQMPKADIEAWCKTNKIRCSFTETYSETVGKGLFLSQSINAGNTVEEGDKITISYSLGKEPTLGQKNALLKAKSYLAYSSFSYKGLIEQLEYEEFSHEEAVYGADNCGANWNEQAAKKAKSYMDYSSFSKNGLIGQLEYEGFTKEQAQYGASTVGF